MHADCDTSVTPSGNVLSYMCPKCKNKDPSEVEQTTDADFQGLTETLTELVDGTRLQDIEKFEIFNHNAMKGRWNLFSGWVWVVRCIMGNCFS